MLSPTGQVLPLAVGENIRGASVHVLPEGANLVGLHLIRFLSALLVVPLCRRMPLGSALQFLETFTVS